MFTKQTLDQYVEDGWLIKQTHPTLPLTIYNYSQATQYAESYNHPGILFAMYDGKDYSHMIWRMIKPKYEKPFSNKNLES